MVINIYLPPTPYTIKTKADIHIGVEGAALYALNQNITLDLVVSDFDSISQNEHDILKKSRVLMEVYPSEKDETDAFLAIKKALAYQPKKIYLYTGTGTRIDHLYANLLLLDKGPITLMNDHVKAYLLNPGQTTITPSLKYISFFAFESVKDLSLEGFKYPLNHYDLDKNDAIGISNEGSGRVSFKAGRLLVIESID